MYYALYKLDMVGVVMAHRKYLSLDIFLIYFDHSNRIPCCAWIHMAKTMWKQPNFHMDYALYKLDMVGVVMAYLKYLSLHIFLRYFDHYNRIPCVSMESCNKTYVETGKFPYGLCLIQVRYGWCSSGSPKISFFRYFVKIF
jgi:hypothetical protein